MPPIIAIVGRPNVGKSTLFNRLTARRTALVSDIPGLTRDRREGEAILAGHAVTVVDTAGLEEAAPGSIPARMRAQSEAAIGKADVVLFVLDARDGVTPVDSAFAKAVRASGRPVVLVANKSEGRAGADGFYEAFRLGLGEPVAISADHGEGIGELVTTVLAALGCPNAGKSTLVNALLGEERMITGPEPGLTRDSVSTDFQWGDRAVRLFDTAGLRRKARISETAEKLSASDAVRALRFAEVVIVLIDAQNPLELQDLTIADMVEREGRALVLAINKWDLVTEKQKVLKDLRDKLEYRLAQLPGVPLVTLSALAEQGLDKLKDAVFVSYERWNRRVPTPALNRWLAEAMDRHTPPATRGRRIKIRFMTQPSSRPPTFVAFCSQADALPKAYLRYLTGSLRHAFDLPGVPIRFKFRKGDNPYDRK
jgi:GTP-binding protein